LRRFPQLALGFSVLVLTACSPACTPPEAKSPEPDKPVAAGKTANDEGDAAELAPPPGEMIMEAKGVDLSKLAESQRATFFQIINSEPSACDKPHSLATSLRDDAACRDSLIVAQFVADRLADGATPTAVKEELEFVVSSLEPRDIPVQGRPVYGSERAPVTVVVFADFQCPHCQAEAPVLRKAVDQFRGRAKLIYKHFPLSGHPRAKVAAVATEAAFEQGKFWEMHDIVFANPDDLEDDDLRRYAQKIGLDMAKFDASFGAKKGEKVVEQDKAHGEEIGIEGTPAVFVNGRYYNPLLFGGTVTGWIDDALKR
jgi:protein-disulfide isomerase